MIKLLLVFFLLFISNITAIDINNRLNIFDKRQAVASKECGNNNNTISICIPTSESIWYNGTVQEIVWKYNNPTLLDYASVDLYLLTRNDTNYIVVKEWKKLDRKSGVVVQTVDDTWYPTPLEDNSPNVTLSMYFYICGSDYDIQTDFSRIPSLHNFFPAPQLFYLVQNSRNTTVISTTSLLTPTLSPSSIPSASEVSQNKSSKSSLPGWAIAIITIASVLVVLTILICVWAYKRQRQKKINYVPGASDPSNQDNLKLSSPTEEKPKAHSIPEVSISGQQNDSFITKDQGSILSSNDALLLADTFRNFMRKPDWSEDHDKEKTG